MSCLEDRDAILFRSDYKRQSSQEVCVSWEMPLKNLHCFACCHKILLLSQRGFSIPFRRDGGFREPAGNTLSNAFITYKGGLAGPLKADKSGILGVQRSWEMTIHEEIRGVFRLSLAGETKYQGKCKHKSRTWPFHRPIPINFQESPGH